IFRRLVVHRFKAVALFGRLLVERDETELPAAFLPMRAAPFAREKIIQRHEKKGPKFSFAWIREPQIFFGDDLGEKLLGQIRRLIRPVSFPAHVNVTRIPVSATE